MKVHVGLIAHPLEKTKRVAGPITAAALKGDGDEGTNNGRNGDTDENVLLRKHCFAWNVLCFIVVACSLERLKWGCLVEVHSKGLVHSTRERRRNEACA